MIRLDMDNGMDFHLLLKIWAKTLEKNISKNLL